jgi:hypothetical protein|nr:MAG TPA: tail assembly chaperone [Caudoviricetes sp.]
MADIKAFLLPPVMDETKEVVITKRAVDENGKPIPFVIRVIDQETNDRLLKRAMKKTRANGRIIQELDTDKYGKLLVDACVVTPNFKDAELCAYYKTTDPLDVPGRMLTMGEYDLLVKEIRNLNEMIGDDDSLEELEEEAKN